MLQTNSLLVFNFIGEKIFEGERKEVCRKIAKGSWLNNKSLSELSYNNNS